MQKNNKKKVGTGSRYGLLMEEGLIGKQELDTLFREAKTEKLNPDRVLLEKYKISKEDLGRSLEAFYQVECVFFDPTVEPPFEVFNKHSLDAGFLKKYSWTPFIWKDPVIVVLIDNPFDLSKVDEIQFILGTGRIEFKVALKQDIEAYVDRFFQELSGGLDLDEFDGGVEDDFQDQKSGEDIETVSEQDSEVVRLVNALLVEAWKKGASDIHIEPNSHSKYCAVRFRVDGTCHEFRKLRFNLSRVIVSRLKIMARLDIAERRLPQDGKIKLRLPGINRTVEFRMATMPTIDGQEDVVLRVLASSKPQPLEELGLADASLQKARNLIFKPYGLVLVVGPTGSGKTTTLHSALHYLNTGDKKIWAAEDPVEITQEGVRQVQINPKIGLTFASALRSFLRSDPDVIMIGEMRDKETAHIGVEASLTGHVVFSTLHTNSAPETVTRLLDMDLDPFNFADSLLFVLAQRLVKTLCPSCKEPYFPKQEEIEELKTEFGAGWQESFPKGFFDSPELYRAKGCRACLGGYKGRTGVHELMVNSPALKKLIKFSKSTEDLRDQAKEDGMLSLKQDGILKVLKGITDIHQVRMVSGGQE
ncbi:MAG: GspE/PulE family protein [Desulfohalobiaceae bacterium]|nr:GspE/PulE family protein [Desulfohalobiaceae bacterium]